MKKICLIISLFFGINSFAQDQIFKKDNTKQEAIITEVTPTQVKYKLFSNPDGPLYVTGKNEIALIIYKNGKHETFEKVSAEFAVNNETGSPKKEMDAEALLKNKNVVFYNLAEIFNSGFGLSYFRETSSKALVFHLPLAFTIGEPFAYNDINGDRYGYSSGISNFETKQKFIDAGLGVYINTSGKAQVNHFIGPLFRFAQFSGTFRTQVTQNNPPYNPSTYDTHTFVMNEAYFTINNGFIVRVNSHFNFMMNATLGFVMTRNFVKNDPESFYAISNPNEINDSNPHNLVIQAGFNFGYRF